MVTTQTSAHLSYLQYPAQLSHHTLPIPSSLDAETLIVQLLIQLDTTTNLPHIAAAIALMMMMSWRRTMEMSQGLLKTIFLVMLL